MDFTSLDAIEFFQDGKKHLRVYYQIAQDKIIREASFDTENGWFVRGNGVVVTGAKDKSPITVTRWNVDSVTEIRLYFLDGGNNIYECQGRHTNGITTWGETKQLKDGDEPKVAEGSKLAVARPDQDGQTLRVFYQEKADSSNKQALRELKYSTGKHKAKWQLQSSTTIFGAVASTSLSAVSAKPSGDVRLYYQSQNGNIQESFWNARDGQWNAKELHRSFSLVPGAPISAICWYVGENQSTNDRNLRLRIYTILKSKISTVSELYFKDGWDDETEDLGGNAPYRSTTNPPRYSAIAAARDTRAQQDSHPISVFYQSRGNVIDFKVVAADDDEQSKAAVTTAWGVSYPGIPTSR